MALPILDGNQTAATLSTVLTSGEHIPAHTVVSLGSQAITDVRSAVSGSVVSISNFPSTQTIAGTVTANGGDFASKNTTHPASAIQLGFQNIGGDFTAVNQDGASFPIRLNELEATIVVPISGMVKVANDYNGNDKEILVGPLNSNFNSGEGRVGVELIDKSGFSLVVTGPALNISGTVTVGNSVAIGSLPAISGTVTANNPSGALTTRFGSVTTANLSQLTSCVTNTSRKYLLAQNISAGTVTIGIGFSPTTTQGIQLAAGGGLTFDAFCPTGAVYWLGAVTGAAFTILEG